MYYSEIFFKKTIYDIVEDDLIKFFKDDQEENGILEFKSGEVSLEKIYKEVTALHNSQGGLIIIGSPRPYRDSNGKEYSKGNLTNSIHKHKDYLYQKIASHISPAPAELRIHDIKKLSGIVQIIDIPKSRNPPHQCLNDGIYYLRFETETRFAPHGIVESLFDRRQESIVNCFIYSGIVNNNDGQHINLTIKIANISKIPLLGLHYIINIENIYKAESFEQIGGWIPMHHTINHSGIKIRYSHSVDKNSSVIVEGIMYESDYRLYNLDEPLLINVFFLLFHLKIINLQIADY